jgi:hypothetical protein
MSHPSAGAASGPCTADRQALAGVLAADLRDRWHRRGLLLRRGADANAKSDDGRTPLLAVTAGHPSYAVDKMLLDHGAKPSVAVPT